MNSLRKARESGNLDQFAKEQDANPPGDEDDFNRALLSMAGKSKEAPPASSPDDGDD